MEKKTISRICYSLLISMLAMLFAASIIGTIPRFMGVDGVLYNSVLVLLNAVGLIILYFLYKFLIKNIPAITAQKIKIPASTLAILVLSCIGTSTLLAYVGIGLNMGIEYLITGTSKSLTDSNIVSDVLSGVPIGVTIIYAVIIGPVLEELIFRKLLIDKLRPFGYKVSLIISAVLFGAYHMNLEQFFYAAFIGLILGAVYYKSGNIKYTIIIHALVNFSSVFISIVLSDFEMIASMLYLAVNLIGIVLFLVSGCKWLMQKPEETPYHISGRDIWCNLGMIIYLVFAFGASVLTALAAV